MPDAQKVNIYSDGTPSGTKIITENGTELDHVVDLSFSVSTGSWSEVSLTIRIPTVQLTSLTVNHIEFICPLCAGSLDHYCHNQDEDKNNPGNPTLVSAINTPRLTPLPPLNPTFLVMNCDRGAVHEPHISTDSNGATRTCPGVTKVHCKDNSIQHSSHSWNAWNGSDTSWHWCPGL